MIKKIEKIELSETTTSYRISVEEVNFEETLDERYRRHRNAIENEELEPVRHLHEPYTDWAGE